MPHTKKTRAAHGKAMKELWADPVYRKWMFFGKHLGKVLEFRKTA